MSGDTTMKHIKVIILIIILTLLFISTFIYLNQEVPVFEYSEENNNNVSNSQIYTDTNSDILPIGTATIETKQPTTTRFDKIITSLSKNQIFILTLYCSIIIVNIIILTHNIKNDIRFDYKERS